MQNLLLFLCILLPAQISIPGIVDSIRENRFKQATEWVRALPDDLTFPETDAIIEAFRGMSPHGEWLPLLDAVADKSNRNPEVLFFMAQASWRAGDVERAMSASEEAFQATDDLSLRYRCAAIARTSQQLEVALTRINTVLETSPDFDDAVFLKASIVFEMGRVDESRLLLNDLLVRNPSHERGWYQLGLVEIREGNSEQALEALQKAVEAYPFFREAYGAMRNPLGRLKRTEDLKRVSRTLDAMREWSGNHSAWLRQLFERGPSVHNQEAEYLALEMMKLGQDALALQYLERYADINAVQDSTQLMMAHLAFNTGSHEKVILYLEKIVSSTLRGLDAYWGPYGLSLFYLGKHEESQRVYDQHAERFPDSGYFEHLKEALSSQENRPTPQPAPEPPAQGILFHDVTEEAGLDGFTHRLGHPEKNWIVDAMGSGVAVGDYDNDGDDDVYFVNGQPDVMQIDPAYTNSLYRNDDGAFVDVSAEAGVEDTGVGMCAIFGDVNNDGWLDLFVGNYGPNVLYLNQGDGTFRNATEEAGVGDSGYAAAAAFGDADGDGDLDLYVGNYIEFDPERDGSLRHNYNGQSVFWGPLGIEPQRDVFYRNDGTGVFHSRTAYLDTDDPVGRAMGAVFFDKENDGDLDLFVANDSTYNFFFENHQPEPYEDISFFSGAAVNISGRDVANMGVAIGDVNQDGLLDFISTAYEQEPDNFYLNNDGEFTDVSSAYGLGPLSYWLTTWGVGFCDFDADGQLDYYTVNGHVYPQVEDMELERSYGQGVSIYRQEDNRFYAVDNAVDDEVQGISGRGSALLDYDNDGDLDIVINCMDSAPRLLENRSAQGNWLALRIVGGHGIHGARVVVSRGDESRTGIVDGGSSYLSQNASVVHFGLGVWEQADSIQILWNGKAIYSQNEPPLNTTIRVSRGDFE